MIEKETLLIQFKGKEQIKLYRTMRKLLGQKKIDSMSGLMRSCTYYHLQKQNLIK